MAHPNDPMRDKDGAQKNPQVKDPNRPRDMEPNMEPSRQQEQQQPGSKQPGNDQPRQPQR